MPKITCPNCNSKNTCEIVHGLVGMDEQISDDLENEKVYMGGYIVNPDSPNRHCNDCKLDFDDASDMGFEISEVIEALHHSWRVDTCYEASEWSSENPARGQCVVSSLVINDYFHGDYQKFKVSGDVNETHYCNVLWNGTRVDSTGMQYDGMNVKLQAVESDLEGHKNIREKLLSNKVTEERYFILKARVEDYLGV